MYIEYCYGPKWPYYSCDCIYIAYIGLFGTGYAGFIQVLNLGRAPHTKETLPDFLKWRRVTRPPLVFRGLTGSQRTPGFWGVTTKALNKGISNQNQKNLWRGPTATPITVHQAPPFLQSNDHESTHIVPITLPTQTLLFVFY